VIIVMITGSHAVIPIIFGPGNRSPMAKNVVVLVVLGVRVVIKQVPNG